MAAPSPIVPLLGAAVIGALGYLAYSMITGVGKINIVGGSRMWDKSEAPKLKAALSKLKATPIPNQERAWTLGPTGTESALARVQSIQSSGSFAVTTDNLLTGWGEMGLSQVLATEPLKDLAPASGSVAVLPALS